MTMTRSTDGLTLAPDAAIDLQLHTDKSDGKWTAAALIDHLQAAGFGLAAITDHDRADIAPDLQRLALAKGFPLLVAVEVSSMWNGELVDFLCYGFDPHDNALLALSEDVARRAHATTTQIVKTLQAEGYSISDAELDAALAKPACQQVTELVNLVTAHKTNDDPIGKILIEAGFTYTTVPPAQVVAAAHASDAVCILAHPGRDDGFVCFDEALLDALRAEAPFDGIEAYYPLHSEAQTERYLAYATKHDLFVSAGSDSHDANRPPIKYEAVKNRKLLEHLGIQMETSNG